MLNSRQPHFSQTPEQPHPALTFAKRGWSVIPLRGTGEHPKAPAIPVWQAYQRTAATIERVMQWLIQDNHRAYGIICGRVSQLLIFDFDELAAYQHFVSLFPQLTNTLTVRTGGRGGIHLYYRVTYPVSSQRLIGGDLLAEGKYAVAPGSVINGKSWQIISATEVPLSLKPADFEAIRRVFGKNDADIIHGADAKNRVPTEIFVGTRHGVSTAQPPRSIINWATLYHHRIQQTTQRNHALFWVACKMRDAHLALNDALSTLVPLHITQPAAHDHAPESPEARRREAIATIRSAYQPRYQARSRSSVEDSKSAIMRFCKLIRITDSNTAVPSREPQTGISQLPNALREKVMKLTNGLAFLRMIEALIACDTPAGTTLTLEAICRKLEGIVGRYSVKHALAFWCDYTNLWALPPHTPQPAVDKGKKNRKEKSSKKQKTPLVGLGRKNRRFGFVMPSLAEVCARFEVEPLTGDSLGLEDLCSVRLYRAALHRALIARRPAVYSRDWQAQRLGTSTRTIRNYERDTQTHRLSRYEIHAITWRNLNCVPSKADYDDGFTTAGLFLEDESGKRYPPYRELAGKLLKTGKRILFKRQLANYYYQGDVPPFYVGDAPLPDDAAERQRYLEAYLYCVEHGLPVETYYSAPSYQQTPNTLQNTRLADMVNTGDMVNTACRVPTDHTADGKGETQFSIVSASHKFVGMHYSAPSHQQTPNTLQNTRLADMADTACRVPTDHSPLTTRPSPLTRLFRKPLSSQDDERIADALTLSIAGVKITSARWIVYSLGREQTWRLVRQIQAMHAKGRIVDPKKYLMRVVSNKLSQITPAAKPKPTNFQRPLKDAKHEAAANRIHSEIPSLTLANARKLVETYSIAAADKTLRQMRWLTHPPAHTGRTPYAMKNPAGFFIAAIRQAWRDLNPAHGGIFPPAPRFTPVKPRKPRLQPYDPLKEFMRLAKRGKRINWSYLEWRIAFHAEHNMTDPFQHLIDEWTVARD